MSTSTLSTSTNMSTSNLYSSCTRVRVPSTTSLQVITSQLSVLLYNNVWELGLHQIWLFQIRPEPDLAETCFWVTQQYASDKTNSVNYTVCCYRGSTVQCFLCCVTVCQSLIKFVEWQWILYFSSILALPEYSIVRLVAWKRRPMHGRCCSPMGAVS